MPEPTPTDTRFPPTSLTRVARLVALAALPGLLACGGSATTEVARSATGGKDLVRQTLVVVEPLQRGAVRDEVVVSAKVAARTTVAIYPKLVNLPVTRVLAEEGQTVRPGEVLAELLDTDLRLAEANARAQLEDAGHQQELARVTNEENKARVTRAERAAQKASDDYARVRDLGDLVNKQEVDDKRLAADTAADDLLLQQFAERSSAIAVDQAAIAVEKARIEAERRATELAYTRLVAPIAGVIANREIDVGELSSTGQAAFTLVDTDDLILDLRVPQDALGRIEPGQSVEVRPVTGSDRRFAGVVRFVNPVLDQATGTVRVRVDLDEAEGLVPGLFCEARIITAERGDALLVSKRAVLYENDRPVLFVLGPDEDARRIAFVAGASTPRSVEIVSDTDGQPLPADLRVVVVGQENLKDGAPVRVVEEAF